jgi:CHAD domain-containing protein
LAKAQEVKDLNAGDRFDVAATKIVAVRARELMEQAEGVLDTSDIERVHGMRVASRRLRAVLEIFGPAFDPDELRPVLRDVKRLADALGARRDPDVQIDHFERLRDALPAVDHAGVDVILGRLRAEQATGNASLAAALQDARESNLAGRLAELAGVSETVDTADTPDPSDRAEPEPEPEPEPQPEPATEPQP